MKLNLQLSLILVGLLTFSCKVKVPPQESNNDANQHLPIAEEDEPVAFGDAPPIIETSAIIMVEEFIYYEIEIIGNKEKFVEKHVFGTSETVVANGKTQLIITEEGSERTIVCELRMHPELEREVFVDIGGDEPVRQH